MDINVGYFALPYIPLLPLVGAIFAFLAGQKHRDTAGILATLAAILSFVLVLFVASNLPEGHVIESSLFRWIGVGQLTVDFTLRFDHLTSVMCLVITGIGSLIHVYSMGYMHHDEARHRFFAYLNLFLFSMLVLVLGGNLPVMFVGWEGVGLCSYLLIGFWYDNASYAKAGMKAFVINRIGDVGFLLAMFLLFVTFGTLDFAELKGAIEVHPQLGALFTVIALSLFVGATGKSAQIPLFTWLPDAMAGPTPVSALIHAATMVTAGIYLMARMSYLFVQTPFVLAIVCVVALVTALVAALTAVAQNDIKKVLAYSTVSQLGFMFLAASVGAYWVAVFHLVTHAFFKACLFLCSGSVIHGCHHEQDMRKMGGLFRSMKVTALSYGIGVLAIAGIFPFSGYYSKHAILEALAENPNPFLGDIAQYVPTVAIAIAFLTAFYMTRSFAMTFLGSYRGEGRPHEAPFIMTAPVVVLAILAIVGGSFLVEALPQYLAPVFGTDTTIMAAASHVELGFSVVKASLPGIIGILLGLLIYSGIVPALSRLPEGAARAFPPIAALLREKFFFDEIYDVLVVQPLSWFSRFLRTVVDEGIIEGIIDSVGNVLEFMSEALRAVQTGQVRHYAVYMFSAAVVFVFFYLVTF